MYRGMRHAGSHNAGSHSTRVWVPAPRATLPSSSRRYRNAIVFLILATARWRVVRNRVSKHRTMWVTRFAGLVNAPKTETDIPAYDVTLRRLVADDARPDAGTGLPPEPRVSGGTSTFF